MQIFWRNPPQLTDNASRLDNIERQRQIESDSVRDGCVRWAQNTEYLEAADTKPYRNLIGISWRSLADAIRAAQDILKTSQKTKLPAYGLPLLSIDHEQMALITLGTLFNMIARSEFETCLPPGITPVAYAIGQRCRIERLADLANDREVNVAEILLCRNRTRNAAKRAADLAAVVDDEDDWANNFRAHHLGEKLISVALQSAVFDGKPIFELKEDQEGSGKGLKRMQRIGMTEVAETWIGEHAQNRRPRYSAGPLVSLLFCLIGQVARKNFKRVLGSRGLKNGIV